MNTSTDTRGDLRALIIALKIAGIAALYATVAAMLCLTVLLCLWEPFLRLYGGNRYQGEAWSIFAHYYRLLVVVTTALVAFLAARSYRPAFQIGGVITGTAAALLFRFAEQYPQGRQTNILSTFLVTAIFGLIFGLLGSVSVRRKKPQPKTPQSAGSADASP